METDQTPVGWRHEGQGERWGPALSLQDHGVRTRVGWGSSIAHHGEILQGVFRDPAGELHRALITLPFPSLRTDAAVTLNTSRVIRVWPPGKPLSRRALEATLAHCGAAAMGAELALTSAIPPGWGLGSSTSDVTSAIRAVADALSVNLSPDAVADLAVKSEMASDSLMFDDQVVLFAHREGRMLEHFGRPLPPTEVLGFHTGPTPAGVDTLALRPARYSPHQVDRFERLLRSARQALDACDTDLLGQVASASARINQDFLPKPHFDRLEAVVEQVGAVGLQVAHSGTIAGLLFDPRDPEVEERGQEARALLRRLGFTRCWRYRIDIASVTGW